MHYIKGKLEEMGKDFVIIENNGIGYKISISTSTISRIHNTKGDLKIYTYLHVREDILALYGFLSLEELEMFELLITVSGIGPKAGLSLLSVLSPSKLGLSILGNDIKALTTVPGIGSKTANRIILELKDKINSEEIMEYDSSIDSIGNDKISETINALISLGYSSLEANSAISHLDTCTMNTESLIKAALKILMR